MNLHQSDIEPGAGERFRRRESVSKSIGSSPSTILMNMIIEGIAALILIFGVVYLARFLFVFRSGMEELHFNVFMAALVFFTVGWGTHIVLKLRTYYRNYREAIARSSRPADPDC